MFSKAEEVSYLFRGLKLGFYIQDPERRTFNLCPHSALGATGQTHISSQETCGTVDVTVKSKAFSELQGTAGAVDVKR